MLLLPLRGAEHFLTGMTEQLHCLTEEGAIFPLPHASILDNLVKNRKDLHIDRTLSIVFSFK